MARNVINLEEIVRDWAWREYDATATASQKKLRRKDKREPRKYLRLEVDWSETIFRDETRWAPLSVDELDSAPDATANGVTRTTTHGRFRLQTDSYFYKPLKTADGKPAFGALRSLLVCAWGYGG